jgi:hypothetical protein
MLPLYIMNRLFITILSIAFVLYLSSCSKFGPSSKEIEQEIKSELPAYYGIIEIKHETSGDKTNLKLIKFSARIQLKESLYAMTEYPALLTGSLKNDDIKLSMAKVERIERLLNEKPQSIKSGIPFNPFEHAYIVVTGQAGEQIVVSGSVSAVRKGDAWTFDKKTFAFFREHGITINGSPRNTFAYPIDIGAPVDIQTVSGEIGAWKAVMTDITLWTDKANKREAELAVEREARIRNSGPLLVKALKYRDIFFCTAQVQSGGQTVSVPMIAEMISVNIKSNSISFNLRNDSGWTKARPFSGDFKYDPETNLFTITARSNRNQSIDRGGPLIGISDIVTVEFDFDATKPDELIRRSGSGFSFTMTRVKPDDVQRLKRKIYAAGTLIDDTTKSGSIYDAVMTCGDVSTPVVIRFEDNSTAIIESKLWINRTREFSVTPYTNPYDNIGYFINMKPTGEGIDHKANDIFTLNFRDLEFEITIDGDKLTDSKSNCKLTAVRQTRAWYDAFVKERRANVDKALALIAKDARYEAALSNDETGNIEHVWLICTEQDYDGKLTRLSLKSPSVPSHTMDIEGSFDPVTLTFKGTSTGRTDCEPICWHYPWVRNVQNDVTITFGPSHIEGRIGSFTIRSR